MKEQKYIGVKCFGLPCCSTCHYDNEELGVPMIEVKHPVLPYYSEICCRASNAYIKMTFNEKLRAWGKALWEWKKEVYK